MYNRKSLIQAGTFQALWLSVATLMFAFGFLFAGLSMMLFFILIVLIGLARIVASK